MAAMRHVIDRSLEHGTQVIDHDIPVSRLSAFEQLCSSGRKRSAHCPEQWLEEIPCNAYEHTRYLAYAEEFAVMIDEPK